MNRNINFIMHSSDSYMRFGRFNDNEIEDIRNEINIVTIKNNINHKDFDAALLKPSIRACGGYIGVVFMDKVENIKRPVKDGIMIATSEVMSITHIDEDIFIATTKNNTKYLVIK